MPFMQRLAMDCQLREYKEALIAQTIDPRQFRKQAVPLVGRSPEARKSVSKDRKNSLNVCVSLYEDAFKLQSKRKQQLSKLEEEFKEKSMSVKSTKLSSKIVENILNRQISEMFALFDSDLDGMISANRIDITRLDPKKLEMLTPLLVEMEDVNLELDLGNFTEAVKRLLKGLSIPEKDYLLGVETKKKVKASTGGMNDCLFRVS